MSLFKYTSLILILLLINRLYAFSQDTVKHLYLGNDTHTDLMWNGTEDEWYKYNLDMARFYLKLGEDTKNNTPEARSKWNYDVAWTLYMMEKNEPETFFHRIVDQIKNGQASVPYNFTLAVYGGSTLESVLRSFYYGGHLQRKYGIDMNLAICQENATIPLGLASLWAGSGAKYSWRGVCNCATKVNTVGNRDHEIYWYTGLDGNRVLMKWYSNYGWNGELGGYSEMLEPTIAVNQMDKLCGTERYPYNIAGAFGKGWDNIHNYSYDLVWGLNHRTLPNTKVYLSNQTDFFNHFESVYAHSLPEVSLSYGNEWDLNLASLAETSGKVKASMEKLRTAEAMAAIISVEDSARFNNLKDEKSNFLYGISVYNIHGWTADGPIGRHDFATYMRKQEGKISNYVDHLYEQALRELGKKIIPGNLNDVYFVFNALNWERSGIVEIYTDKGYTEAIDLESGEKVPGSISRINGEICLKLWLKNIPSTGYKLIQLVGDKTHGKNNVFSLSDNILETPYYKVNLSKSGAITSLFDKNHSKEWVKGLLNDLGCADINNGHEIEVIELTNHSITLFCQSSDPVKHETSITFYAMDTRIDFQNKILQNFDSLLHWTFNFNIEEPEVWHEEVGAIIQAKKASAGGYYADRMARYDYLTLNHFVNVGNSSESITLSNANCLFFKLGNSKPDFLDMNSSNIHILVGGQVNENLGIISQDGDSLFEQNFSLQPHGHAFKASSSMKFALEHQNSLCAGPVLPGGTMSKRQFSFVKTNYDELILWTLKPGEEEGITLRFWNLASNPLTTKMYFHHSLEEVTSATHVETKISTLPFSKNEVPVSFNQQELKTLRIWIK